VKNGAGHYLLKPVIKIVPNTANGIDGFVEPALIAGNNVVVSAQINGTVVESTVPASTGRFFLARLAPGTYDVVVSAKGHATAVITGVPVVDTISVVTLSTSTAPIVLPTSAVSRSISGTVLLNPVNPDEVIFVSAKQDVLPATILVPATTVTVRTQSADLTTGAYSLLLPAGAPLLGQFGALPITLDAQTNPAGKYVIEASATGYATQTSFEENVSTSDQPNVNFTLLVP
jgi:hypothetical protein